MSLSAHLETQLEPARNRLADALGSRSIAIAQEWLADRAGSEKVFEALACLMPRADLLALTASPSCRVETGGRPITTTFLDRPTLRDRRSLTLPLMPVAWRVRAPRRHDVVITSAHAFARVAGRHAPVHLSYVHSPARYLWFPELDSRTRGAAALVQRPARSILRRVDRSSTAATTALAANSETTRRRIQEVYDRESTVIHPPVDTVFYDLAEHGRAERLLAFGRMIPYKRFDAAIEVAARVDLPITIAGTGPDEERLRQIADRSGAEVDFVGRVSDDEVRRLYQTSRALLFFGEEDFGIIPVEAQACGLPVVAGGVGGTLETVVDGVTGAHAASADIEDLVRATELVLNRTPTPAACRSQAERFSYGAFADRIATWVALHAT